MIANSLGVKGAESFFTDGTIFVEGPSDIEILESGFRDRVSGYKITKSGGRQEVEKEIKNLQKLETAGKIDNVQIFIFDNDGRPTSLTSTKMVLVKQLARHCIENYLLDSDALCDVFQNTAYFGKCPSRGSILTEMKEIAEKELKQSVAKRVYSDAEPENPGYRPSECSGLESFAEIGAKLVSRLRTMKENLAQLNEASWQSDFSEKCEQLFRKEMENWDENWKTKCDGKRVLDSIYKSNEPKISLSQFKKQISIRLSETKGESWRALDSLLNEVVPQKRAN